MDEGLGIRQLPETMINIRNQFRNSYKENR